MTMTMKSPGNAQTYYNLKHPLSYSGNLEWLKQQNVSETWLNNQPAFSLHRPARRRGYPTRKYRTSGINDLWQIDLLEMIPYAKVNNGYRYILTCIDVFSRFARAVPLKSKSAKDVYDALSLLLHETKPVHIQTDLGKEFYNSKVAELLKSLHIEHYSVHSQFKAALVERFNRTLRTRLNRYFTYTGRKVWHTNLQDILKAYNNTKHRGLGYLRPIDVTKQNEMEIWSLQENSKLPKDSSKRLELLDYVRVSHVKGPFLKNFDQNWSEEVFRIIGVDTSTSPTMYTIEDLNNSVINGKFYMQELQKVPKKPDVYRIEKVIKTSGFGMYKQYLVKWVGYSSQYNSWVKANDIVNG